MPQETSEAPARYAQHVLAEAIAMQSQQDRAGRSKVHPFMVPLIEALQHKRPHWEFEAY